MTMQTLHGFDAQVRDAAPRSAADRRRARGWFRDPALWAWVAVALLALLPLRFALPLLLG